MKTKKQINSQFPTTKLLRETFESHKWERYLEKDYTKKSYFKRIIFFFPSKTKATTYLKESEYKEWRLVLEELTKTK